MWKIVQLAENWCDCRLKYVFYQLTYKLSALIDENIAQNRVIFYEKETGRVLIKELLNG